MVVGRMGLALTAMAASVVLAAAEEAAEEEIPFVVRTEFSERNPWERSQVLYTVRIYRPAGSRRNGRIRSLDDPVLLQGEALIEQLGTDREYNARSEDSESLMLERRYALFPQSPGELLLMPVGVQWIGGEYGFRTQSFGQRGIPERLEARRVPVPPDGLWLPATDVRLSEEFERSPDDLITGEPLIRTFEVRVEGQPARQIPELDPGDGPNFRHFIERPEFEDIITGSGLVGVRRQRAALLALKEGDLSLPPIRLNWWNTVGERWEVAELPQRVLKAQAAPPPVFGEPPEPPGALAPGNDWLASLLTAGWFLTAVAWWVTHRVRAGRHRRAAVLSSFARDPSGGKAEVSRKLAAVAAACRAKDAHLLERALLDWARAYWGRGAPRNLHELAERLGEPASTECRRLSSALYATRGRSWDGKVLLAATRRPPLASREEASARSRLPRLWPGTPVESG